MSEATWVAHDAANAQGEPMYDDPETGYRVFTEAGLAARGRCCGSGCRHCPYAHNRVAPRFRASRIQRAAMLLGHVDALTTPANAPTDVVLWSGGKFSWLAWLARSREPNAAPAALLTWFDARTRLILDHGVRIEHAVEQARYLGVPLIGIPLQPGRGHAEQVCEGLSLVPKGARLVHGGGLRTDEILAQRCDEIARASGLQLHAPLTASTPLADASDLSFEGARCVVLDSEPDESTDTTRTVLASAAAGAAAGGFPNSLSDLAQSAGSSFMRFPDPPDE